MLENFHKLDQDISRRLRLPQGMKTARALAAFLAHSGDSWFWLAGLLVLWLVTSGNAHRISALLAGAIVIQASLVLAIKFLIKRRRPEGEWGAIYRNTDPHSFPSGHAVRAVMLAVMVWGLGIQPLSWLLTFWAPLVSLARVSLGVHYFSDVLAGWLLGILLALGFLAGQPIIYALFPFAF